MSIRMFDSITPGTLRGVASTSGEAVAGYVGGSWPDYQQMVGLYPNDQHLSIAVNASEDAECLDVERGDAVPAQAPDWVRRQHARGVRRPCVYSSLSQMPAITQALTAAGIPRSAYRLWAADWTYVAHIPAGYDACQWTDHAFGRNLDESLCADDFFGLPASAPKPVAPKPKKHRVKAVVGKVKRLKPHPKFIGASLGGSLSVVILAALHGSKVNVDPQLSNAIGVVAAAIASFLAPSGS